MDIISDLFTTEGFLSVIKVIILIVEFFYCIFAFIVVRQISLMNKTFSTILGFLFSLLSYMHFFAAVGLLWLTLVLL